MILVIFVLVVELKMVFVLDIDRDEVDFFIDEFVVYIKKFVKVIIKEIDKWRRI